jgi:hypothetical protein
MQSAKGEDIIREKWGGGEKFIKAANVKINL